MAAQNSFDIVSQINLQEVDNAINQAMKEVITRFDFKGSKSKIFLEGKERLVLISDDEFKLKSLNDILQQKLVKRSVPLKALQYAKPVAAADSTVRQEVTLQQGIATDRARDLVRIIKDSKLKVQAAINGDLIRVSGKDIDTLQQVIKLLKSRDFDFDMQFTNYRSH
jgi:cyclic-di-GMP-binding protein